MIDIQAIAGLAEDAGLTIKNHKPIIYKSGWQVATEGIECRTAEEVMIAINEFGGNCGIWFSKGIYYVDKSHRVNTKREAMKIGRACNQISVLNWRTMGLAYC